MYTYKRRVAYSETSEEGYADIAQIADYFQDTSSFQSDMLGVGIDYLNELNVTWIMASWQIVVKRYPKYGEEIVIGTWPYNFDTGFGYRNFSLHSASGEELAVANSVWLLISRESGHPVRLMPEITGHYDVEPKADMEYAPRKISFREQGDEMESIRVPRAYLDTNRHMNNAQYIRMLLEYIPEEFHIGQVRVEYKTAAVRGDRIIPYVYNGEGIIKARLEDGNKNTYALLEFKDDRQFKP